MTSYNTIMKSFPTLAKQNMFDQLTTIYQRKDKKTLHKDISHKTLATTPKTNFISENKRLFQNKNKVYPVLTVKQEYNCSPLKTPRLKSQNAKHDLQTRCKREDRDKLTQQLLSKNAHMNKTSTLLSSQSNNFISKSQH